MKTPLWLSNEGSIYCLDHIIFADDFEGKRATLKDYADHMRLFGSPMVCDDCEAKHDDKERFGNVHLLFGADNAFRLQRARAAHPAGGQTSQGISETGEKA